MVQKRRGKWRVQMRVGGRMISATFSEKQDAIEFEKHQGRLKERLRSGLPVPLGDISFREYAKKWMKRRMRDYPEATWSMDGSRLDAKWVPRFGNYPIKSMSRNEIMEFLDQLMDPNFEEKPQSAGSRNRHLSLVHKLFEDAITDGYLTENPSERIPRLTEQKKTRDVSTWDSASEAERYIAAAYSMEDHSNVSAHDPDKNFIGRQLGLFAEIAHFGGIRTSEICALKNKDIDLVNRLIVIRRVYEKISGKIIERTKGQGEGGEYMMPIFDRVYQAILRHRETSQFTKPNDFLIHRQDGSPISPNQFRHWHENILKRAKLKKITPHGFRKFFATFAESAGFTKEDIQLMLGHSDVRVTQLYTKRSVAPLLEKADALGFGRAGVKLLRLRGGT